MPTPTLTERLPYAADDPRSRPSHLHVEPWADEVVDRLGHDPRSGYVERFWLGVLGPSTVWLLRRVAARFEVEPDGFELDLDETARWLGVGHRGGKGSPLLRAVDRCCTFGMARPVGFSGLVVRRRLPPHTQRQVERLHPSLQAAHQEWQEHERPPEHPDERRRRARALALSLLQLGEDREAAERQLHRWRFHPAVAHEALRWAAERHAEGLPDPSAS